MTTTDSTTTPARAPGTVPALVRLFIVQERFNEGEWLDDPDQPDDYTHGFDQAKWWMENDNKTCRGHETTYEHRIIERTETQVWPNVAVSVAPPTRRHRENETRIAGGA